MAAAGPGPVAGPSGAERAQHGGGGGPAGPRPRGGEADPVRGAGVPGHHQRGGGLPRRGLRHQVPVAAVAAGRERLQLLHGAGAAGSPLRLHGLAGPRPRRRLRPGRPAALRGGRGPRGAAARRPPARLRRRRQRQPGHPHHPARRRGPPRRDRPRLRARRPLPVQVDPLGGPERGGAGGDDSAGGGAQPGPAGGRAGPDLGGGGEAPGGAAAADGPGARGVHQQGRGPALGVPVGPRGGAGAAQPRAAGGHTDLRLGRGGGRRHGARRGAGALGRLPARDPRGHAGGRGHLQRRRHLRALGREEPAGRPHLRLPDCGQEMWGPGLRRHRLSRAPCARSPPPPPHCQ